MSRGFTHFNKVSGKQGVYKGAEGSEVQIDVGNQVFTVTLAGASTAVEAAYITLPYAATLVSAYGTVASGTTGTGATITITATDTAGAALFGSVTLASAGTAGQITTTFGTASTATLAALSVIAVVKASCATAYGETITITATKAS